MNHLTYYFFIYRPLILNAKVFLCALSSHLRTQLTPTLNSIHSKRKQASFSGTSLNHGHHHRGKEVCVSHESLAEVAPILPLVYSRRLLVRTDENSQTEKLNTFIFPAAASSDQSRRTGRRAGASQRHCNTSRQLKCDYTRPWSADCSSAISTRRRRISFCLSALLSIKLLICHIIHLMHHDEFWFTFHLSLPVLPPWYPILYAHPSFSLVIIYNWYNTLLIRKKNKLLSIFWSICLLISSSTWASVLPPVCPPQSLSL